MSDIALYDAELECALNKLDLHSYLELASLDISNIENEYNEIYYEASNNDKKDAEVKNKMKNVKNDIIKMVDAVKDRNNKVLDTFKDKSVDNYMKNISSDEKQTSDKEASDAVKAIRKILDENIAERDELMKHAVRTPDGKINDEYVDKYIDNVNTRRRKIKDIVGDTSVAATCTLGRMYANQMVNKDTDKINNAVQKHYELVSDNLEKKGYVKREKNRNKLLKKNDPDAVPDLFFKARYDEYYKNLSLSKKLSLHSLLLDKEYVDSLYRGVKHAKTAGAKGARDAQKIINKK